MDAPLKIGPDFTPFTDIVYAFKPNFVIKGNYNNVVGKLSHVDAQMDYRLPTEACVLSNFPSSLSQELTAIGIENYICYKGWNLVDLKMTPSNIDFSFFI